MDFPRRMRDWLFNVMRDLAQREELPARYKELQFEAETNLTRRWANAAVWKWCDLDGKRILIPLFNKVLCLDESYNLSIKDHHTIVLCRFTNCSRFVHH